jgi:hypothetical protein
MSSPVLERLLNENLQANACAFSTAPALRLFLAQRPEIHEVREGLRRGTITESDVSEFVGTLMERFREGVLFPHDVTLGGLAVACADVQTSFAHTLLRELGEMSLSEMPLGPRIAREVLAQQASPGGQSSRDQHVASPVDTSLPTEPAQPPT